MEIKRSLLLSALTLALSVSGTPHLSLRASEAAVQIRTSLDRPVLPEKGGEHKVVIKIEVEGGVLPQKRRTPLNLAIVLDRSGSMSGGKLEQAKQAASLLVDELDREDILSLVVYESGVEVVRSAAPVGDQHREIKRLIQRIETGGSTALYGGVEEGSVQLREYLGKERINRVMLLSDGIANVGPSDNREIVALGTAIARQGMSVTTIGLGNDYNESLMTSLAEASDANYYYVADIEKLPEVFEKELGELKSVVARDLVIEIRCPEGVRPLRFLGRPGDLKSNSETITFSTVSSGQAREVYLECLVTDAALGTVNQIAQISTRYADAVTNRSIEATQKPVVVGYSTDLDLVSRSVNQAIVAEATIYANAEETEKAVALADKGDAEGARGQLDTQLKTLKQAFAAAPAAQQSSLSKEIEAIAGARAEMNSDELSKEQRKKLTSDAYKARNAKR
ncbi:MAG TPA: VWA domain-containing protein [Verrucomicrobiales bacterium]|jgi:Ca-activated chloride channel family protein|nr:VWA domain-containing protein [Verrucomicrobiales bacterium]